MDLHIERRLQLATDRHGVVGRRDFLHGLSAAAVAGGSLGWTDLLSTRAADLRRQGMACILLWMPGGPSQFETLDPKPGHDNGGETKAIDTAVSGIRIADNLPKLATMMKQVALLRSLSTKEGNHQRASYLMHTSNVPLASLHHPTIGSVVTKQVRQSDCELPAFVRIGNAFANTSNGGFLGTEYDAFAVVDPSRPPENVAIGTSPERFERRLAMVAKLEQAAGKVSDRERDHDKLYANAARMIRSPQMKAYDLAQESDQMRSRYGKTAFGNACLLARRLVEAGVTFVEAALPNWDTHQDNFDRHRSLCGQLDQPYAALLGDLYERGMLERTLVVWMGEFGRTPRINPRGGRDHYPKAFSAALAGAGIRGGQVVGATDASGEAIKDRPYTEKDLFQTIYKCLKVDATREYISPIGRPIKVVDGGQAIQPLLG